ncbi:MAG: AAA family ATPase [Caldilineaceae bacterium SB0668_bin_21]|nr:AAA family ATPase [Caldilineaceae bacterium SB0668_bin_21]MYC22646.1 AAA family ATPase [Caldilineaceae bacterium SB0662_bin_25]
MITRIELDGFKTFQDFTLDLSPLQVIVGANGVGKSNLFDALHLIGRLADSKILATFHELRGDVGELFSARAGGGSADCIKLAVEILVDQKVQDDWGTIHELRFPRMRYELEIARRQDAEGQDRLILQHEFLTPIPRQRDRWTKSNRLRTGGPWIPVMTGGRSSPYISSQKSRKETILVLHQDGNSGRRDIVAMEAERTLLSGARNTEFPHAFAAAEEMRAWQFLHLDPEILRQPSPVTAPAKLGYGGRNLPNVLARMKAVDPELLTRVSSDLANHVPGAMQVDTAVDPEAGRVAIWAKSEDGRKFSSRVLSDGALRALALVTLRNDPEHRGLLCFENPESSVHPSRLKDLTQILKDLTTDFSSSDQEGAPLRQVICNTHSPVFISHPEILSHVLFAHLTSRTNLENDSRQTASTRIVPVIPDPLQPALPIPEDVQSYTLSEVQTYLESADLGAARSHLGTRLARDSGLNAADSRDKGPA